MGQPVSCCRKKVALCTMGPIAKFITIRLCAHLYLCEYVLLNMHEDWPMYANLVLCTLYYVRVATNLLATKPRSPNIKNRNAMYRLTFYTDWTRYTQGYMVNGSFSVSGLCSLFLQICNTTSNCNLATTSCHLNILHCSMLNIAIF